MESIKELFSISNLISGLIGILVSLLAYEFGYLGKKEWFGITCSVWVGFICIIATIALLSLGLYWYIPCVLFIPIFTIGGRWLWLKQRKKKLMIGKDGQDYDIKRYEYYEWLSKKELFRWEVKEFLLPSMNILFEIGAIKKLSEKLEELAAYKDWYKWKRLKSYVLWNRHEYREMIELLTPYMKDDKLKEGEKMRVIINIFGAYRNLEDHEGTRLYIKIMEEQFFDKKVYTVEAADDLMYYYDEHGMKEKIERLKEIILNLNFKNYSSMLDFYDVVYFQNRRHDDTESNRILLDEMLKKRDLLTGEERRMIFDVRLLTLYFENDYGWRVYSVKLFNDADSYLNYSSRVAFEYLRAVNMIVQNSRMHNMHPGHGLLILFNKALKKIEGYVAEFDKELIELPEDFLYRKKEMLMLKKEFLMTAANEKKEYSVYIRELGNTLHKIISLCEKDGDDREKVHFLMVLADEMIAFREDIESIKQEQNLPYEELVAISKITDEDIEYAKLEAVESVQALNQALKQHHYDRTLAYNIVYASILNMKLGDTMMAKEMMTRFHATGVDIRHYTLAVQKQYNEVKERLS